MQSKTIIDIEARRQRINNVLLLNASFIDNLGLMHGKMGIAIYFFHLARDTQKKFYEDYAGELIDEIYEEITLETPLDFENGLAGIGWGIEYLVQNAFIEADIDEVLEDFDNRLKLSEDDFVGIGLLKGITGLCAYYLKRIQNSNPSDVRPSILRNKQMLVNLIDELEVRVEKEGILKLMNNIESFDLTMDYPVSVSFLIEVYRQDLNTFKVGQILHQLLDPLFRKEYIPGQHSKRLIFALVLEQFRNLYTEHFLESHIDEIIKNLLTGIDQKTISYELSDNFAFVQNGTSGIKWIYRQLFQLTGKEDYQKEEEYWSHRSFEFNETDQGFAGFTVAKGKENIAFGLLEGLAGIALFGVNTKISNFL